MEELKEVGFNFNIYNWVRNSEWKLLDSMEIDTFIAKNKNNKKITKNNWMDVRLKLCIDYCSWLILKVFLLVYLTFCRLLQQIVAHTRTRKNFLLCQWPIKFDRQFNNTWRPLSAFLFVYLFSTPTSFLWRFLSYSMFSALYTHNINGENYPSTGTIEWKH